jgi:hypothetical protein
MNNHTVRIEVNLQNGLDVLKLFYSGVEAGVDKTVQRYGLNKGREVR